MKYFFIFIIIVFLPVAVLAIDNWDTCPYGEVNEPAPGTCPRYIDTDNDHLCDYSEPSPTDREILKIAAVDNSNLSLKTVDSTATEDLISGKDLKTKKVYEIAEIYGVAGEDYANALAERLKIKVKLTDSFQLLHDNYGLEPSVAKDMAVALAVGENVLSSESGTRRNKTRYKLVIITIVLGSIYFLTSLLVKFKQITLMTMRRFWNIILLLSFLVTSSLGILLIIRINFGWYINLPFNMLYWHVEIGTIMAEVAIMHAIWHWRYYLSIIK